MSLNDLSRQELEQALADFPGEIIPLPEKWLNLTFDGISAEKRSTILAEFGNFFLIGAKEYYLQSISGDDADAEAVADHLASLAAAFVRAALDSAVAVAE